MKDIKGFEGLYAITSCGKVWSYKSKKFLSPSDNGRGYQMVILYKNGKQENKSIHRLVAETYIPNPNGYDTVDHIDGDKSHNYLNNLQWLSRKDNVKKAACKKIYCLENEKVYESQKQAAIELGLDQGNISRVCRGIFKQTGGYHFKFMTEEGNDK